MLKKVSTRLLIKKKLITSTLLLLIYNSFFSESIVFMLTTNKYFKITTVSKDIFLHSAAREQLMLRKLASNLKKKLPIPASLLNNKLLIIMYEVSSCLYRYFNLCTQKSFFLNFIILFC